MFARYGRGAALAQLARHARFPSGGHSAKFCGMIWREVWGIVVVSCALACGCTSQGSSGGQGGLGPGLSASGQAGVGPGESTGGRAGVGESAGADSAGEDRGLEGPLVVGTSVDLKTVVWSGSVVLANGDETEALLSTGSGGQWQPNPSLTPGGAQRVIWDGNRFLALESNRTLLTSKDGRLFSSQRTTGADHCSHVVIWSGVKYVALGSEGMTCSSPDALDWTEHPSGVSDLLVSIVWTGSQFYALGESGSVVSSPDAVTWTIRRGRTAGANFKALAYSGSRFVAVGGDSALTSIDGTTWNVDTRFVPLSDIAWSKALGVFAAVDLGTTIYTTPDGVTWTSHGSPLGGWLSAITWAGDRFIAVGSAGAVVSSRDGAHWVAESQGSDFNNVVWTGDSFVALGQVVTTSADAGLWSHPVRVQKASFVFDVARAADRFVFAAQDFLLSSPDLITWTGTSIGSIPCRGVAWTGTRFVVVCADGFAHTSPDGLTWSASQVGDRLTPWLDVLASDNLVLATGDAGAVATSPDGLTWTVTETGAQGALVSVASSGQQFVAVSDLGEAAVSSDGVHWTSAPANGSAQTHLNAVAWAGSGFVAVGQQGLALTSVDGLVWNKVTVPDGARYASLNGIALSPTRCVAVGESGLLVDLSGSVLH